MTTTRRTLLAAAGAGLAPLEPAPAAQGDPQTIAELARRSEAGNAALLRGDVAQWVEQIPLAADFRLMSPFGGRPSEGPYPPACLQEIGRFFRNGHLRQELVQAWGTADMVVLAVIERGHVEAGGLPAQDWDLRVTLAYRREGAAWLLVHRHADPLARGIDLAQAAALGRGAATPDPAPGSSG